MCNWTKLEESSHKSLKKGVAAANFILLVICFTILLGMPNDQRTTVPSFKGMKVFSFLVNVPCSFSNEKTFFKDFVKYILLPMYIVLLHRCTVKRVGILYLKNSFLIIWYKLYSVYNANEITKIYSFYKKPSNKILIQNIDSFKHLYSSSPFINLR